MFFYLGVNKMKKRLASEFEILMAAEGVNPEIIQKSKDFLWNHLSEMSKKTLIHIVSTNSLIENGLKIEQININRNLIIGVQYSPVQNPDEKNPSLIAGAD